MPYLYPLIGITAWVVAIAFSTNALISVENKKQQEVAKSFIERTREGVVANISPKHSQDSVTAEVIQKANPSAVSETVTQPKIVTPVVVKPIEAKRLDESYEEEEEDD